MNSYNIDVFLETTIICSLSALKCSLWHEFAFPHFRLSRRVRSFTVSGQVARQPHHPIKNPLSH